MYKPNWVFKEAGKNVIDYAKPPSREKWRVSKFHAIAVGVCLIVLLFLRVPPDWPPPALGPIPARRVKRASIASIARKAGEAAE